jgi:hypothetical protein
MTFYSTQTSNNAIQGFFLGISTNGNYFVKIMETFHDNRVTLTGGLV